MTKLSAASFRSLTDSIERICLVDLNDCRTVAELTRAFGILARKRAALRETEPMRKSEELSERKVFALRISGGALLRRNELTLPLIRLNPEQ